MCILPNPHANYPLQPLKTRTIKHKKYAGQPSIITAYASATTTTYDVILIQLKKKTAEFMEYDSKNYVIN